MKTADTVHLLLLTPSSEDSEAIISLLRSGGVATRGHKVTSSQDFHDSLNNQHWDLLIIDERNGILSLTEAQEETQTLGIDLPCILLLEEFDPDLLLKGFNEGAKDVIGARSEQHLLHVIQREVASSRARYNNKQAALKLAEANQRADQLLSDTQDAIAYMADGMHIQANDAYAQIFAYEDTDDLTALPIIDLIADADQEKFKAFWRHFNNNPNQEEGCLHFTAINQNDEEFAAMMKLSASMFDGEACTQVAIRTTAEEPGESGSTSLTATGLPGNSALYSELINASNHVDAKLGPASLTLFEFDKYQQLLSEHTLSTGEQVFSRAAEVINKNKQKDDFLAEFNNQILGLISYKDNESSLESALKICKALDSDICDLGGHTVHYSFTAGIANIDSKDPEQVCNQAYEAIKQAYSNGENSGATVYIPQSEPATGSNDDDKNLSKALKNNKLFLLFQPIISLRGDSREHYEVFIRMQGNQQDYTPDVFLSQAKDTQLDRWIIVEATKQLAEHRANDHDTRLVINLTENVLLDEKFVEWVGVALKAANLPYDAISFQFSETHVSSHLTQAKEILPALREMGCIVSISDFGRADAEPLKTLKHIEADYIKIDSAFILSLQKGEAEPQVLKALVNAISERNAVSIVPCVENASILATLWQVGVNYIQGHYLQPPAKNMNYEFTEIS